MSTLEKYDSTAKLEHVLTTEERESMVMELVRAMGEIDDLTDALKEEAANTKSKIQKLQNSVKRLTACVKSGSEYREVPIEIARDFVRNVKTFTRLDTHEIYREDPLGDSEEDRQPSLIDLPDEDAGATDEDNSEGEEK